MKSFTRNTRRAVLVSCVAGAAVIGAVGVGTAAFADGTPTPAASQSASTATGAPAAGAPAGGPAGGPAQGKHEPHVGGTVLTVSGSTITVQDPEGFTRTIRLADAATVVKDGKSATTAAIVQGAHIEATGSVASDRTTLTATAVRVGAPAGPRAGGAAGGPAGGTHEGASTPPKAPKGAPTGTSTDAPTPPTGAPTAAPTPSTTSLTDDAGLSPAALRRQVRARRSAAA